MQIRFLVPWLVALAPVLTAQGEREGEAKKASADERYAALQQEVQDAVNKWRDAELAKVEKARAEGGAIPAMSMIPPYGDFVGKFQAAAGDYAGTDDAVRFLMWIAVFGGSKPEAVAKAIDTLVSAHLESEALVELPQLLTRLRGPLGDERVDELFDLLEAKSPHAEVRGQAIFARASAIAESAALGSEAYAKAKRDMQRAAELQPSLAARVRGIVNGRELLAKGNVAPDIEGIDLDGVAFKLSDYQGKVIMLDFWGDW